MLINQGPDAASQGQPASATVSQARLSELAKAIGKAFLAAPDARSGRYTLVDTLAAGSQALVCLARDNRDDRQVVVRFPHAQSPEVATQFRHESELLAKIKHPLIVPLLDSFESAGRPFTVLEYVEGQTLGKKLAADGPMSPSAAATMIEQIAGAVDYLHEGCSLGGRELLHRDLKPAHVILRQGDGEPRLIDFGMASYREDICGPQSMAHCGTLEYMSPEQATAFLGGSATVDRRADIWALGAILFEQLTAERLFQSRPQRELFASPSAWGAAVVSYLSPRTTKECACLVPSTDMIPAPLHQIIRRCLEKHPAERYQTAAELAAALRQWREGTGR